MNKLTNGRRKERTSGRKGRRKEGRRRGGEGRGGRGKGREAGRQRLWIDGLITYFPSLCCSYVIYELSRASPSVLLYFQSIRFALSDCVV